MKAHRYLPVLAALAAPLAFAHPGHAEHATFMDGFLHPLTGLDHLLAMIAVGLWSVSLHRNASARQLLALPAAFVAFLLLGIVFGNQHATLPAVEPMIAVSLLVLGIAAGIGRQISQVAAFAVVALFATFHGYAHGAELGGSLAAIAGITLATALLHVSGIGLGLNTYVRRAMAAFVTAGGVFFLLQLA
jgi:urease accessory protein